MGALLFHIHEWLADHVTGIQYPRQPVTARASRRDFLDLYLRFTTHAAAAILALFLLLFSLAVIVIGCVVLYAAFVA